MNIIITGASRGIGFETTKILCRNHKVLALSRNLDTLKKLQTKNPNLDFLKFDIADKNDLPKLSSALKTHFSTVDILVNNAGCLLKKPFEKISEEDIQTTFETNFFGVIRLTQLLLPLMKKSSNGHIVNIGSMGGFQGSEKFQGMSVYSSAKAALACLTECLAPELGKNSIKVNCLAIGSVQTKMLNDAFPGYKAPLSAKQMAAFIADFCINGHRYFNGKILPVSVSTP